MFAQLKLICAALLLAATPALANDQQLYDPTPPADSAYIRFINAGDATTSVNIGDVVIKDVKAGSASAYHIIKADKYEAKSNALVRAVNVEAGNYYTLAVGVEKSAPVLLRFEDALSKNPAKSMVYFYNLSDAKISAVVAPKHKAEIIANVATNNALSREMNALTLDIAVTADGGEVNKFDAVALKRRSGHTIVLHGKGSSRNAFIIENEVAR